ncbi:MAG: IS1595 family transposase [Gemmatimonadaceae bacterium]
MTKIKTPETLREAMTYFADPDVSLQFLQFLRWPEGVVCAHCDAPDPMFLKTRRIWKCKVCRKQFSVKLGTVFEDSPLGLDKWLPAIWMLANSKNGISSYEMARSLGVTQKTAWFMLGRIRLAMQTKSFKKMSGSVETDETFIGGLGKNMHRSKKERLNLRTGTTDKTAIVGHLQRADDKEPSSVRTVLVPKIGAKDLHAAIRANVERGSVLYTDKWNGYRGLKGDYRHEIIDHGVAYVRGLVHTNGLENFWSLLKRTIKGTYVSVDPFHMFRYLDEQTFRFNLRKENDSFRFAHVVSTIMGKRLTYKQLIGANLAPATT